MLVYTHNPVVYISIYIVTSYKRDGHTIYTGGIIERRGEKLEIFWQAMEIVGQSGNDRRPKSGRGRERCDLGSFLFKKPSRGTIEATSAATTTTDRRIE